MIPNKNNFQEKQDESLFDRFISLAVAYDENKSHKSLTANSQSDDLNSRPGSSMENIQILLQNSIEFNIDSNELTVKFNFTNQSNYIFITDFFGKIWFEREIDATSSFIKINTENWPIGNYNITNENDGTFSFNDFEKLI